MRLSGESHAFVRRIKKVPLRIPKDHERLTKTRADEGGLNPRLMNTNSILPRFTKCH